MMRKHVSPVLPVLFFVVAVLFPLFANTGDLDSSLIEAAKNGDKATMENLLFGGADVNQKNNFGQTALYLATDEEVIQVLKRVGAKEYKWRLSVLIGVERNSLNYVGIGVHPVRIRTAQRAARPRRSA